MAEQQEQKTNWPEQVGKTFEEAKATIEKENPGLQIVKVLENSPVTMDFRPDRVRVTVDSKDVVVIAPITG